MATGDQWPTSISFRHCMEGKWIHVADQTQCVSWSQSIVVISDTFPLYALPFSLHGISSLSFSFHVISSFLTPRDHRLSPSHSLCEFAFGHLVCQCDNENEIEREGKGRIDMDGKGQDNEHDRMKDIGTYRRWRNTRNSQKYKITIKYKW